MSKGKKGRVKTGVRRRKDTNNIGKEKEKTEEDEVSSCSTEPHETIASFLKQEEVQELLNILQTKDLIFKEDKLLELKLLKWLVFQEVPYQKKGKRPLVERESCLKSTAPKFTAKLNEHLQNPVSTKTVRRELHKNDLPILIGATILGKVDLVKRFLREGCTLECFDQNGMTPYLWAVKSKNMELIELFAAKGADPTAEDVNGDNSLIHAVKSTLWDEDSVIQFQQNYKQYFDVNYQNKTGNSALHFAVRRCWINFCKILIDLGADINSSNQKGITCLMMAASKGYDNMVFTLLQYNADAFVEDQRGCTALCYAISKSNQKKTENSNQIVTSLLNAFPSLEREKYLIRRLQILMNPGKRNDSGNIIETFLSPVFSYFVKRVCGGLGMLLKGKVFDIIFQALKNHIGQTDYTISILGILSEVLNYCDCCVNKTNPNISETDVFQSFFNSQCPKMCIIILKHSGMSNLKNIASPTFLPLFLVCPSSNEGRKWLQNHYIGLQPFYQKFTEMTSIKYPIQADEFHLKLIKKKVKMFKNLMSKLQNGDSIVGKNESVNTSEISFEAAQEKENPVEKDKFVTGTIAKKTKKKSKLKLAKKGTNYDSKTINTNPAIDNEFKEKDQNKNIRTAEEKENLNKIKTEDPQSPKEEEKKHNETLKGTTYDPSDLFGLLARSRSAESSEESETDNCNSSRRNSEKEQDRMKQVATAMSTIFCVQDVSQIYPERVGVDYKSSAELKQYFIQKPSDENIEPSKRDLSPALNYLQSLFEDFIAKHQKVWNYERSNNYPDYKPPKNEDEAVHLMKLKIVLSQLEEYYLKMLTEEWSLLLNVIRNKVWYSEEASNDVISKIQELLLKKETHIMDKLRNIEEEEIKNKYLDRKLIVQNEKYNSQKIIEDIRLVLDKPLNYLALHNLKYDYFRQENDFVRSQKMQNSNTLRKTSSQSILFEKKEILVESNLSQGSSGPGLELNTIFFNKGYKSDSYSEIVSIGSKTGSSQSIPTPRNEEERKEQYNLWTKTSDNPLEKLLKTMRQMNDTPLRTVSRFCCWQNEINSLKKMIANSHVQYGEILLPNPLKSGKILLPYGETGYFGSVEMGLDQKGNPVAVKHVKKSFPTSVDVLSNIMIRLRKIKNKYLLPYYMSEGFEPIIATPLMNFNLGQYILHLKTNCSLEYKAPEIIKQVVAGLHYLHTQKPPIVHGNLKPSNVLIDDNGVVKLAEFGISVALYLKKPAPPCSMIWWPGEVITSYIKVNKLRCTLAADVATAGMLIHFILSGGQHPFGQQVKEIVDNLIMGKWNLVTSDNDAEDLISWMLVFLPENRPTILAIVRHIYFWSAEKRWKFLLTCAGARPESGASPHDISQLHTFLDIKTKENNIQGDWKTLILSYFPNCKDSVKNLSPNLTGLLNFLRQCLEDRKRTQCLIRNGNVYEKEKLAFRDKFFRTLNSSTFCGQRYIDNCVYIPYYCDLRSFFFNAFPVIALSIYRMLEGTQWMEVPFFLPFNEPYNLS